MELLTMPTDEFNALTLIISSNYHCQATTPDSYTMEEDDPTQPPQIVNFKYNFSGIEGLMLYRFEDKSTHLLQPYFNHNNTDEGNRKKSPKYLVSMCDYMIVCSFYGNTYVLLFELKRGTTTDCQKQLEAGEYLFNYFCDSIDRIKTYNGIQFDRNNIRVKKFLIKQVKTNKQDIMPSSSATNNGTYFKVETHNELRLLNLLRC